MSIAAIPAIGEPFATTSRARSTRTRRALAVGLISLSLVFGTAKAADAAIIPYTKGSEFWYSWVILNGRAYSAGNVKYSWSWMWEINANKDTIQAMSTMACGFLTSSSAKTACTALVTAYFVYIKGQLAIALANKQCLQFRFGLPPLGALQVYKISRVTCTR